MASDDGASWPARLSTWKGRSWVARARRSRGDVAESCRGTGATSAWAVLALANGDAAFRGHVAGRLSDSGCVRVTALRCKRTVCRAPASGLTRAHASGPGGAWSPIPRPRPAEPRLEYCELALQTMRRTASSDEAVLSWRII